MKRRDFMVALAVCVGAASPAVQNLVLDRGLVPSEVLAQEPSGRSEPEGTNRPQRDPLPADPNGPDPQPDPTPQPTPPQDPVPADACPACGRARIEPRGRKFLSLYTR